MCVTMGSSSHGFGNDMDVDEKNGVDRGADSLFNPGFPPAVKRSIPRRRNGWVSKKNRGWFPPVSTMGPVFPDEHQVAHSAARISRLQQPGFR